MGYRFSKGWVGQNGGRAGKWARDHRGSGSGGTKGSGSGGTNGSGGCKASGTKSYHNGGVEGSTFAKWYDEHLASKFDGSDGGQGGIGGTKGSGTTGTKGSGSGGTKGSGSGGTKGSGSGGTKGSGSSGTKGSGSGGTKGSGSGGTKGSGSGGTKGSGSGGTKGSGSGGTKGSGSGGTKGSGSGGTKGSGSGGTKGIGSGGTKGSGSGGTKGSGSGGTKGSGSGGTKGSGSGGTKGSGSGGTKGSGSGGTKGSGSGGTKGSGSGGTKGSGGTNGSGSCGTKGSGSGGTQGGDPSGDGKPTLTFKMGDPAEVEIEVVEENSHQLFFKLTPLCKDQAPEIDGLLFNMADGSSVTLLNFSDNQSDIANIQADEDNATVLHEGGLSAGGTFDVGLQFGRDSGSENEEVTSTNFTLWTHPGTLSFEDIDLSSMRLIVDSDENGGDVLDGDILDVTGCDDPDWLASDADAAPDSATALMDALSLTSLPAEEEDPYDPPEEDVFDMV